MSAQLIVDLMQPAIVTALVTYILTVNVAKSCGNQKNYQVDPNQEFFAYGLASVVGGFCGAQPPSGSFSRSALVIELEAKSALHNLVSSFVVLIMVQFLTVSLYYLPKVIMASIIYQALKNMIQFGQARFLWSVNKVEFSLWLVCFLSTAILGVTYGIVISILFAILVLLKEQSRPSWAVLGRLPGTEVYRNIKRYPQATEAPGIKVLRFDASIHFASKDHFETMLERSCTNAKEGVDEGMATPGGTKRKLHTVIVDCSSVNFIDTSGVETLKRAAQKFGKERTRLYFANWKGPVRETLEKLGFYKSGVPLDKMFLSLHDAVLHAVERGRRIKEAEEEGMDGDSNGAETPPVSPRRKKDVELEAPLSCLENKNTPGQSPPAPGDSDAREPEVTGAPAVVAPEAQLRERSARPEERERDVPDIENGRSKNSL
jgi:MFS superfamily sulfate permease-like transporter